MILYNCDMYCKYKTEEHHFLDGISGREMPKLLQIKKIHLVSFKGDVHIQGE